MTNQMNASIILTDFIEAMLICTQFSHRSTGNLFACITQMPQTAQWTHTHNSQKPIHHPNPEWESYCILLQMYSNSIILFLKNILYKYLEYNTKY